MHKTEGGNATSQNEFTDGPPGTNVEQDWLNAVQNELVNSVEDAGLTIKTASSETGNQLTEATRIFAAAAEGGYKNLIVENNSGTPNSQMDIDADSVTVIAATGEAIRLTSLDLTANIASSGANGLDTGAEAGSTWYYLYVIYNGTTVASLISASSTAPTLPSGYTYSLLVGVVYNSAGSHFVPIYQLDNFVDYDAVQTIKNGGFTTTVWTAQSITAIFPPIAKRIKVGFGNAQAQMGLSPRSDGHAGEYFRYEDNSGAAIDFGGVFPTSRKDWVAMRIRYVSSVYYWTNNADSTLVGIGWSF